jgi:hypothetical protein
MIPYEEIPPRIYGQLVEALSSDRSVKRATKYLSDKLVVRLSARTFGFRKGRRTTANDRSENFVLTIGAPNYAEREFIKKLKAADEPFPVKKIQLKFVALAR